MGGRTHEMVVNLRRDSPNEAWGFSLVGGSDVNAPLIVTRVGYRSPADGQLQRGDIITKVANYDARDIRHQDAQTLFSNAGNNVRVVVQRESQRNKPPGSAGSSHTYSPLSVSPHMSPRGGNISSPSTFSPGAPALQPYYSLPFTPIDHLHGNFEEYSIGGPKKDEGDHEIHVVNQPYRTTPLVLPGAKVKRDSGHTESYLRHHPNPTVRARPHHMIEYDNFLKQKVANTVLQRIQNENPNKQIVHKQFNSPINVYSDSNIADTIYKQTGVTAPSTPARKLPPKYNPEESETYRAVREETYGELQEVPVPPQSKIFAPNKTPQPKKSGPVYALPAKHHNPGDDEPIQQSGSFKRLMWSVMAESNY